ncbi:MAG: transglutaminase-like domain-containing protein, partial [Bacteroidales bacterium]|nr:transglutaminase-like domain-containing protein [Bacteroidales bacterium]
CICFSNIQPDETSKGTPDFDLAIEFNGIICGYSEIVISDTIIKEKNFKALRQHTFANFSALGRDITQHQKFTYIIDTETGNWIFHDSYLKQNDMEMGGTFIVDGNFVKITSMENSEDTIITLPQDCLLPNTQIFNYLRDDFSIGNAETKSYQVLDVRTANIKEITYTKVGEEELEMAGNRYNAVILKESDPGTNMESKIWIDKKSGMRLKMESSNRIKIFLTDALVKNNIKTGNWDVIFFKKTNKSIKNIKAISYLKAHCIMEPEPAPDKEDLQVPGQQFEGTIDGNYIDGIFEIAHVKFDGKNAPVFPVEGTQIEEVAVYMAADDKIEAGDPVLITKAKEITYGSENAWEATCRLSNWVAENIDGSIMDGSARETYDQKSGLCGAQSRLMAALCRAVGIPARVVWGCMYTKEYGGSFGHHGWNEVYMGEAGWIPIDVTIHETDYVDSGHIRLGVLRTNQTIINYKEMEILEFEVSVH